MFRFNVAVVLLALTGCQGPATGGGGGEVEGGRTLPPVQTNIPPGIYTGDITWETESYRNSTLHDRQTTTEPYFEVVDDNGLPLIQPAGETPVEGLRLTSNTAGHISTHTVQSVSSFENRVVITYESALTIEGVRFGGSGSWTYEYVPPDTLRFTQQVYFTSEAINWNIASMKLLGTAELTK